MLQPAKGKRAGALFADTPLITTGLKNNGCF